MYPELFNIYFNGFLGLGTITISSYAVCIVLGVVLATLYGKRAARKELNIHISNHFIYLLFIAGYVGGKVFLYLEKPLYYISNPSAILDTFSSGFVFYGSFIFIVPTAIWYFKKHKIPVLPLLDIAAISVVIIQIIGRIGCFFAGCCYGIPTESAFGVTFPSTPGLLVHPTQLYESSLLAVFLVFLFNFKNNKKFNGQLFLLYLGYYGISRCLIELYRGDMRGQIIEGLLSHSQAIAICLVTLSIIAYYKLNQVLTKN